MHQMWSNLWKMNQIHLLFWELVLHCSNNKIIYDFDEKYEKPHAKWSTLRQSQLSGLEVEKILKTYSWNYELSFL